jgi:hypothetical protein
MLGQIWLVQIVVYPLFAKVGERDYIDYHRFYSRHISLPVILPGFASFLPPVALAFFDPARAGLDDGRQHSGGNRRLSGDGAARNPASRKAGKRGKNELIVAELIRFNWPRTALITLQAIVTMFMMAHVVGVG